MQVEIIIVGVIIAFILNKTGHIDLNKLVMIMKCILEN